MRNKDTILIEQAYLKIYENVNPTQGMDAPPQLIKFIKSLNSETEEDEESIMGEAANDISEFGAKYSPVSDEDMTDYLQKTIKGKKTKESKYRMPYVHRSNIETVEVVDDNNNVTEEIDIDKFKRLISVRPESLIKQNAKMKKTGGETQSFYNTSLPALKGLAMNEKTNEFVVVDTCPSSGICKTYCYAKKGGYVQWKASSLSQTRILNFLINDWEGYKSHMISELSSIASKNKKKGSKTVLRWNDSGDMLSDKYFQIVMDVARLTPDVQHYAYTKEVAKAKHYENLPSNFIFNFSHGGLQDRGLSEKSDKISVVVPDVLIKGYIAKNQEGKWAYKSERDLAEAKRKISLKYNIGLDTMLSIEELSDTPMGEKDKYNVIVLPGESDLSASRSDVKGTYLILH